MTAQQIDVHGLPASWMELADTPGNSSASAAMRLCARELEAALRQSGEAVYQFGSEGYWHDIDKETFDWWMNQGAPYCRLLYTTPPTTSGLVEALLVVRDVLAASPIDCLGEDEAADGMPYPIRDEVIDRISKALAAHDAGGGK